MKIKDLIAQLSKYNPDAHVVVYDDDNDRTLSITCVCDDDDVEDLTQVLIIV